jgi:hypothetical protein
MLAAARAVVDFTTGRTFAEYSNDLMLRSALERQVEIIGEGSRIQEARMLDFIKRGAIYCLWIVTMCGLASAFQKTPVRFEVASIKSNKSGVFGYGGNCIGADKKQGPTAVVTVPVGHCRLVNVPVEYVINLAYWAEVTPGADPPALVGLPAWAKSERFDVDTKAEDLTATQAQLFEMLRTSSG